MSVSTHETLPGDAPPASVTAEPGMPRRPSGAWLAVIALWAATGIALLSVSFALARNNMDLEVARLLLWGALAAMVGPPLMRLLGASTGRWERILLVAMTALMLYWVKVLHDPGGLFLADEFHHMSNTQRLVETGRLYGDNLLLPVSAHYPGLSLVTAALSQLSGFGLFTCALLVVGLAKVSLSVALFLVFERLSASPRIAGVGALFFCANSNYLFFTSQFSYESLSLPLLGVLLVCLMGRSRAATPRRRSWSALGCLIAIAVALTHHLTAYAMVAVLWVHVALTLRRREPVRPPLALALVATTASLTWATLVAGGTKDYLTDIFGRVVRAVSGAFGEEALMRTPFQGGGTGVGGTAAQGPPLDEQMLAVASVLLVALAVAAGLVAARRRSWTDPLVLILGVAAVAALGAYPLRIFPGAWETSNRTSEFLFLGASLMAAVAAVTFVERGRGWRIPAVAGAGVIAIAGGSVIGWPGTARLPRPFTAEVAGAQIQAQGPQMAEWAKSRLPPDATIVANATNGRLLSLAGFDRVIIGGTPGVTELLSFDVIPQWQWDLLREKGVDYVVLDRRLTSFDNTIGYFYPRPTEASNPPISNWRAIRLKFERLPGSGRVFDSGDIVVYDIHRPVLELKEPPPVD